MNAGVSEVLSLYCLPSPSCMPMHTRRDRGVCFTLPASIVFLSVCTKPVREIRMSGVMEGSPSGARLQP